MMAKQIIIIFYSISHSEVRVNDVMLIFRLYSGHTKYNARYSISHLDKARLPGGHNLFAVRREGDAENSFVVKFVENKTLKKLIYIVMILDQQSKQISITMFPYL